MDVLERLGLAGVIPVAVFDNPASAVPTCDALAAGGINVIEVTLRTAAGIDAIANISKERPDMLVGAGTVLTAAQCEKCVEAGAKFIVSPGFSSEIADWCSQRSVATLPGCVTPSEIMTATARGLSVLKFFPAGVYGGLDGIKALAAPFTEVRFVPTGGVNADNLGSFARAPFIHAVGGSWVCPRALVESGDYAKITELSRGAVNALHGFEIHHIGINPGAQSADDIASKLCELFDFERKEGASSIFASSGAELMRNKGAGDNGHIAVAVNNISRARAYLEQKGVKFDDTSVKIKNNRVVAVYLCNQIAGFAIHLLQK